MQPANGKLRTHINRPRHISSRTARIFRYAHCAWMSHGGLLGALVESADGRYRLGPMARYIFITGGVVSSLGKGLASAALGALLQAPGYTDRLRDPDPHPNVHP